jgi:hypothetical protein
MDLYLVRVGGHRKVERHFSRPGLRQALSEAVDVPAFREPDSDPELIPPAFFAAELSARLRDRSGLVSRLVSLGFRWLSPIVFVPLSDQHGLPASDNRARWQFAFSLAT